MGYLLGLIDDEIGIAEENKEIMEAEGELVKVYKGNLTNKAIFDWIMNEKIDCAIIDHQMLSSEAETGTKLIHYLDNLIQGFPFVLLTAFKDGAAKDSLTLLPNVKVYDKEILEKDDDKVQEFYKDINNLIKAFKYRMSLNEERYEILLATYREDQMDKNNYNEFIALDNLLKAYQSIEEVPLEVRSKGIEEKFDILLKDVNKMLEDL